MSQSSHQALCANCDAVLVKKQLLPKLLLACPGCGSFWQEENLALAHRHRRPIPEGTQVSLVFEPNGSAHDDLVLRIGAWALRSDSYYYALDRSVDTRSRPQGALVALLRQWKCQIEGAEQGIPIYLPHNFSDQSTGWIRGVLEVDRLTLLAGWSSLTGHSFAPSSYLVCDVVPEEFTEIPQLPAFTISRSTLLHDLEQSLSALHST